MKKISKIFRMAFVLVAILSFYCVSFADVWDTTLEVVKKASNVKNLENNQGRLTHEITSYDKKAGEIKLRLTLTNTAEKLEEGTGTPTEIYIILSENLAINESNYKNFCAHIQILAKKVFDKNPNSKIGIIGMKGPIYDWVEEGDKRRPTENDQGSVDGTENDSEVVIKATNNYEELMAALVNMNSAKQEYYLNLQSALITAQKTFSKDANKILISLYDRVPYVSVGTHDKIVYTKDTAEQLIIEKTTKLVENTKQEFLNLKKNGINFIQLRPSDTDLNQPWNDYDTGELILNFDGTEYVRDLYGTFDNPTYGKMYSLEVESFTKIVTENIYEDIVLSMNSVMTDIKIREYLTQEIMDNFTFTIDDADADVDTSNLAKDRYFVWNINQLNPGAMAILNYTLKIKDMQNRDIFDKIISINDKIDISYKDSSNNEKTETEPSSPQVKLTGKQVENNTNTNTNKNTNINNTNTNTNKNKNVNNSPNTNTNTNKNATDNTTAPTILPKTGSKILIAVTLGVAIIGGFVLYVNYRKLDDVK